jgi:hypothetical protein
MLLALAVDLEDARTTVNNGGMAADNGGMSAELHALRRTKDKVRGRKEENQ